MKIVQVDHDTVREILERSAEKRKPACFCGMEIMDFDFSGVNMTRADLGKAVFIRCSFDKANLSSTDMRCSSFFKCSFVDADLSHSSMMSSDFGLCNFTGSNLSNTDMRCSSFFDCSFVDADLSRSSMMDSDFSCCSGIPEDSSIVPLACPEEGSFIGWKKVYEFDRCCTSTSILDEDHFKAYIVKLLIPEDALRSSATGRKCRCSKAKVLDICSLDGKEHPDMVRNYMVFTDSVTYRTGEFVYPDKFDPYRWNECSNGIHFFITREEAVNFSKF